MPDSLVSPGIRSTLADLTTDRLAIHRLSAPSQARNFRYERRVKRASKSWARNRVVHLFSQAAFPHCLSILTMPNLDWRFERALLNAREGAHYRRTGRPKRTLVTAIERDEAIYRLSLIRMPQQNSSLVSLEAPLYATQSFRTYSIARFHRCRFEHLAGQGECKFYAAWLDFNGPINLARMAALRSFWDRLLGWRLVLTTMNGRWSKATGEKIAAAGGYLPWIMDSLPGAQWVEGYTYQDGAAMLQLALDKPGFTRAARVEGGK